MLKNVLFAVMIGILSSIGCSKSTSPVPDIHNINDSFEGGVSAWSINSMDIVVGSSIIDWYVASSDDMASHGSLSAKLYMDNATDAAKVWLERKIIVSPNRTYSVTISFDFASHDHGDINNFSILANVFPQQPTTREDIVSGVQDGDFPEGTFNGGVEDFVWLEKSITKSVKAVEDGEIHIILGIWGTWEGARTYYFDNLKITLTGK